MYYDASFIILIPALVISFFAQIKINSTFEKYSKIYSVNGYTGAQTARLLLDSNGLYEIPIEVTQGKLSDHYDPSRRIMRLSQDVYYGTSVASIGVAAHETGHAIQHKINYMPLKLRNTLVPIVNFSSNASWILFMLGIILRWSGLISIGIILFSAAVLFQLVTLPVEFDASKRALLVLRDKSILFEDEIKGAKSVLDAAAMTYVAAALMAVSQLLRLILISNRNRD